MAIDIEYERFKSFHKELNTRLREHGRESAIDLIYTLDEFFESPEDMMIVRQVIQEISHNLDHYPMSLAMSLLTVTLPFWDHPDLKGYRDELYDVSTKHLAKTKGAEYAEGAFRGLKRE